MQCSNNDNDYWKRTQQRLLEAPVSLATAHQGSFPSFYQQRESRQLRLARDSSSDTYLCSAHGYSSYTSLYVRRFEISRIVGLHDDSCGNHRPMSPHGTRQWSRRCRCHRPVCLPFYGRCPSSVAHQSGTMVVSSNFSLCFLLGTCAESDAQPRNETVTVASRRREVSRVVFCLFRYQAALNTGRGGITPF